MTGVDGRDTSRNKTDRRNPLTYTHYREERQAIHKISKREVLRTTKAVKEDRKWEKSH